ncbi:MAG: glycerophosphodiester phosphodiesterase family protein [Thermofilaceae archaeon]
MLIEELKGRFFVVAHRGASGYEPENTLRAVRRAIEIGVDAVEVDVRVSKEGVPVVIHDDSLDRTTNGRGRVRDMTVAELRRLDAGKGERIPLLEEVLDEVKERVALFLELKEIESAEPALHLVLDRGMLNQVLFISFDAQTLSTVKRAEPRAHIGLIYAKPGDGIVEAKRLGCEFVLPHFRLATEKAVAFAHRMKLMVVAWTVDDPALAAELKGRGVDGVASNYPDLIIPLRGYTGTPIH